MKTPLDKFLERLNLVDAVFHSNNGSVYDGFTSEVQKKIIIIQPDAYYIFNSQPLILFFDLTNEKNQEREIKIHKQVWSFDNSPIIFVIKGVEVIVYNALNFSRKEERLEEITLSEEQLKNKFSFWELQSGFTWEWLENEYFNKRSKKLHRKRVNDRLFENIKTVREYLTNQNSKNYLKEDEANSLILRLIFIRYLIDRKVKIDSDLISGSIENVDERRKSFINLIKQPSELNLLFEKLNNKFNGVLFKKSDITLSQQQSDDLSEIFKGELQTENSLFKGFFFEIFDFSIIPVEVISGIYESLIDEDTRKLDAAVYTPPFLVEYVLSDTVDKYLCENGTSDCRIFEVAVGSGIFLVQSLRKMIDKEIELNPNQSSIRFSDRIREIAKTNLFGIDINEEALKVSCFSIYIALLDYQHPKDIDVYEFPNLLNENLFQANYFDIDHIFNEIIKTNKPKFILGNPPWKKDSSEKHLNWVNSSNTYSKTVRGKLEIAQSFLLRTKDFMAPETQTALIVTSTLFYNVAKTSQEFKKHFLTTFCVNRFFDLSPVRRLIFEKKDSPASIVYFRLSKDQEYLKNVIKHQSVKSNHFLKHFKILVLEKYDQKNILQKHFLVNEWMFKTALYGNSLDFDILIRLNSIERKLSHLIEEGIFFCGDGILKAIPKPKPFEFLLGLPYVENKEVNQYFTPVNKDRTLELKDVYLSRGRELEIFEGQHIYLKSQALNESEIVVSYNSETSVNKHDVTTITTKQNISELKKVFAILTSNLYTYYQFLTSSAWGVGTRPAIRQKEYLSFPIIDPEEKTSEKLIELVEDLLTPLKEYYNQKDSDPKNAPVNYKAISNINDIVNDIYKITDYEKDLIDYVLNVSRYQFQESKQHLVSNFTYRNTNHYRNKEKVLQEYAEIYIDEFQNIYQNEFLQVEVYPLDHFVALNFVFYKEKQKNNIVFPTDKKNENEVLRRLANKLSVSQITNSTDPTQNLYIQKDIKGFEDNSFYIIKPNEYKCWHRAIAWYDLAEFKEAIEKAELSSIKNRTNEL